MTQRRHRIPGKSENRFWNEPAAIKCDDIKTSKHRHSIELFQNYKMSYTAMNNRVILAEFKISS